VSPEPATVTAAPARPADGSTLAADESPCRSRPAAADVPAGYELLGEVGRGGMGVVYRARDVALDREVAVKVLQDKYPPDSPTAARFVDEARLTAHLQHPGIPAVYHVGTLADGRPFLAMKLIKGQTLDELLRAGTPVDPLAVIEAVGQAVGFAHARGVIHRDLKPANVMVGAFGEVQVMDWGLAKVLAGGARQPPESSPGARVSDAPTAIRTLRDSDGSFTQAGTVLGTPAFMPPEQAAGELAEVDTRSDVFGLGAILCVLLTGRPPFDGKDSEGVRLNAVRGNTEAAFARLDGCGADPGVVALCKRCLAFDRADRPAAADEVASAVAALRRAADDRARHAERDKLTADVRAAEQAKRRRAVQRAAAAVAAVLLLGVAGTTAQSIRADAARGAAETAEATAEVKQAEAEVARQAEADHRRKAEAKEAEATAVVTFFEDRVFAAARPLGQEGGLGHDVTLRAAIAASRPALTTGFADQPLVEARLCLTLGRTYFWLGEPRAAAECADRARAVYADRLGPDHPDTLRSMNEPVGHQLRLPAALRRRGDAARGDAGRPPADPRPGPPGHADEHAERRRSARRVESRCRGHPTDRRVPGAGGRQAGPPADDVGGAGPAGAALPAGRRPGRLPGHGRDVGEARPHGRRQSVRRRLLAGRRRQRLRSSEPAGRGECRRRPGDGLADESRRRRV